MVSTNQGSHEETAKSAGPAMPLQAGGVILTTTAAMLVGVTTLLAWIVGAGRPRDVYTAFGDVATTVVADAAWLMPLLFGVILAILAVLFGQGFTDVDENQADVNRRRLAVASWVVAGVAAGVFVIAALGAIGRRELAPHLWSVTVTTCLVTGAALWVGTVIFGSAKQQLRVNRHTMADVARQLAAVPRSNRSRRPLRKFMAGVLAVTVMSTGLALTCFWTVPSGVSLSAWFSQGGALFGLAALASAGGVVLALFAAYFRDATVTRWVGWLTALVFATFFVGLPVGGFLRSVVGVSGMAPLAVMTSVAFAAPMLSAVALPRTWCGGFTLRGALDALRASLIAGRLMSVRQERARLEALVPDTRPAVTPEKHHEQMPSLRSKFMRRVRRRPLATEKVLERPAFRDAVRRALHRAGSMRE